MPRFPRSRRGTSLGRHLWDEAKDEGKDQFIHWVLRGSQPTNVIQIDPEAVLASASKLASIADEFGVIGDKVGEGYAKSASFGTSAEARKVATDWNTAVDTRQAELHNFALRLSKMSDALKQVGVSWRNQEAENQQRIRQITLGVTKDEQRSIDDNVRGRDQKDDVDDGTGSGGDQDGGTGD